MLFVIPDVSSAHALSVALLSAQLDREYRSTWGSATPSRRAAEWLDYPSLLDFPRPRLRDVRKILANQARSTRRSVIASTPTRRSRAGPISGDGNECTTISLARSVAR
jgi:hypothetical protein